MSASVIDLTAFRAARGAERADLVRQLTQSQTNYCGVPGESLEMDIARSALALTAVCQKFSAGILNGTAALAAVIAVRDELKGHAMHAYNLAEKLERTREKARKFKKQARRK